ncbi:MAG: GUN4-like family protein [candidate division TA06 bacterium 34_109]|uniref:GUN4-like family protein n=1 Tax=candidate division TA06 bacterium 34_109 TaxID=1635277 RepID=A0A124G059_UNCT6|nr:MAG: GUN4-like family protein [candidate division TA06 bacterium 34_109]
MVKLKDIFICHASEDKESVVKPLLETLDKESISYWYDEAEIKWGESIPNKINEGLRISRYVIVVLSNVFLSKNWPQKELTSALNIESSAGEVKVLPLIVGNKEVRDKILLQYPILNDKRYIIWEKDVKKIVEELKRCLGRSNKKIEHKNLDNSESNLDIPIPKIPKEFSQLDKDRFIKNTFSIVKQYFRNALNKLKIRYQEIEFDIDDIDKFKFICAVYKSGGLLNKCKIWVGSPISDIGISYSEGDFSYGNDGSYNDWLTVNDDGFNLGLKPFGFSSMYIKEFQEDKILTSEEAAKYLWIRFTNNLYCKR